MRLSVISTLSLLTLSLAAPVRISRVEARETPLNAFLTILLNYLPDISGAISDVVGILTGFEQLLADLTGDQTTYNELSSSCAPYTVIFARGTSEPGNVGILVGPPFFDALASKVGSQNLVIQGVNGYSASVQGYIEGGDPAGSTSMASEIQSAHSLCPNTKLVVGGYSQGGQIVHNAIGKLPASIASWISKVVIFGDPDSGTPIPNVPASKVHTVCHSGDNICVNGDLILLPHLTYGEDAGSAAAFVVS